MKRGWTFALLVVVGCSSLTEGDGGVAVRLHNLSATAFDSVTVQFPDDTHRYGPIAPGAVTGYAPVRRAYRYARIEAWVGAKPHVLQPIDFVGEHLLPEGTHTYGLTLAGEPPQLGIVMADEYAATRGVLFLVARAPATEAMQALFEGRVIPDAAGCLRLEGPDPATVIWPYGFRLVERGGELYVLASDGREFGRIGGRFRFGGGEVPTLPSAALSEAAAAGAQNRCPGRYWLGTDLRADS